MTDVLIMIAVLAIVAALGGCIVWLSKRPRRMKIRHFQEKWLELQKLCANKENWAQAILDADKLLGEALKKKRFAGKSMGERLMAAQRVLTDNEAVWFGHKLRNKLLEDPATKLKEKDVKEALIGFRQALKDLGALPVAKVEQAAPVPESQKISKAKAKPESKTKAKTPAKAPAKAKAVAPRPRATTGVAPKPAAPAKRPVRRKVVQ